MNYKTNKKNAFTLVELLIAVTVFVVVVSVVLSLFITGLKGHRKVIAIQDIQDNARFLLGFIAKEIRMSEINGNPTSSTLEITRSDGEQITYIFDGQNIQRTITDNPDDSGPINSEEVLITGSFYTMGIGKNDDQQPRVTIIIKAEKVNVKPEEEAEINIQTTLSQRDLDS